MMTATRKLDNWIDGVLALTNETEAPTHFWKWSAIYTLGAALQRKVWVPFGLDNIYPNLYIFIVAPPGKCRKGGPVSLSKKLLTGINLSVCVDSTTKAALTQDIAAATKLDEVGRKQFMQHSSVAIISKELSSLLIDLKPMIEALTDLFDSHDEWEYKTKNKGKDKIYGPCISVLAATTPNWLGTNLPFEAIGDGFTSRIIMVTGQERKSRVTFPYIDPALYEQLRSDLEIISLLRGPFSWSEEARRLFTYWYEVVIDEQYHPIITDDRFVSFLERIHILAIKTAMAIRVAYSNDLVIEADDIQMAIQLLEEILPNLKNAYGALGRSKSAPDLERVLGQIKKKKKVSLGDLQKMNWRHLDSFALNNVLGTIEAMRVVKIEYHTSGEFAGQKVFVYLGGE